MNTREDASNYQLEKWQICRVWKLTFVHNTSVFLFLLFVPAWSHEAETRSSAYYLVEKVLPVPNR